MARFTFKLPDIGEGIAEAEIVAWHVAVGDRVEEDQNLADMMTDKATVEMESPVAGTVVEIAGAVGDQVAIGAALVVIETDAAAEAPAAAAAAAAAAAICARGTPGVQRRLPHLRALRGTRSSASAGRRRVPTELNARRSSESVMRFSGSISSI